MQIRFNEQFQAEDISIVLARPDHSTLGMLQNVDDIEWSISEIEPCEVSFVLHKFRDGVQEPLWDEVVDFKYIFIPEWDTYLELNVTVNDEDITVKNCVAQDAAAIELSNSYVYNLEINTEADIKRTDYLSPTVFYDETKPKRSLLNRVLYKLPNWSIGHVDNSLKSIQRMFSSNGSSVYEFLTKDVAQEIECLFKFDSKSRTISAYDLKTVCVDCGNRGEFSGECPKCGSKNLKYYGQDSGVFLDVENILNSVNYSTNVDEVKNCFHLEAGDDNMTAAVINRNPNGSAYIYYFSDEAKHDMPPELVEKLESYDDLMKSHDAEYNQIIGNIYEDIDKILYYNSGMMPAPEEKPSSSLEQASKITSEALSPMGMPKITSSTSVQTVNTALKQYIKVFIKSGWFKAEVNQSNFEYVGTHATGAVYGWWTGNFKITNYSDEEDTCFTDTITIMVWDNYHTYLEQKLEKKLADEDDEEGTIFDVLKYKDLQLFKEALKLYGLHRLQSFHDAIQGGMDILVEQDQAREGAELYEGLYLPYYEKLQAVLEEIQVRTKTIEGYEQDLAKQQNRQKEIQSALNFENYLGTELYHTFLAYKKEDNYSNSNFISNDLDNKKILENAQAFLDKAKEELFKSGTLQHQISADINNLTAITEFQPFLEKFETGNWMTVAVDGIPYRLRLVDAQWSASDRASMSITFSDVVSIKNGYTDVKSMLDKASNIVGSYGAVANQVNASKEQNDFVKNFVSNGFDATTVKIVNNASNQNITIGEAGLLARRKIDFTEMYEPYQVKLLGSGLYVTNDGWKSTVSAIGKYIMTNPDTGKQEERMGVLADSIVGRLILGNELGIYSSDGTKTMSFDNFGLRLNVKETKDGTYSRILDISKTDKDGQTTSQLYLDTDGNLVLASDQIIQMHDKLDTVEAEIGNFDKLYVKEATIEKLLAGYIKAEDIEAFNAEFKKLIASEAEFDELKTNNATIYGLLKAANADIDNLTANKVSVNDLDAYKITVDNLLADKANISDLEADYIKADAIDAKYAKITQLDATNANIDNLNADVANINTLVAGKADITDLNAETARIDTLIADLAQLDTVVAGKITADEVDTKILNANKVITDDIQANTAEINQIKADYVKTSVFDAKIGRIDTAIIGKADITDLNAANANIGTLQGQYANIETILSGSVGTGTLQTIHLTAQNFVAESGVIKEAMIGDLAAGKITSGSLNTDNVTVKSSDGSMILSGSLQQFYDENNVCRIQMGKDAQGKFSFTIFDEAGTGVLIDSKGIHSDAIADGLIVDKHVANNANIAGSKLDINSVVQEINDNSTTTLKSNKIWIDEENQSLGASFKAIKTTVGKSVANIVPYYMLGESEITAPTSGWSTTPPTNGGPYLWRKDKKVLSDGTEIWDDPYLVRFGDNVSVIISSSEGTAFKGTGVTTTTLTCTVYKGGKVVTPASYAWKKKNGSSWDSVGTSQTIQVAVASINSIANYKCEIDI